MAVMEEKYLQELATTLYHLAQKPLCASSGHHGRALIKLPPVFTCENDERYGQGRRNLVAMLRTIHDYEGSDLILADLPRRYNAHGGAPELTTRDLRKVHNWLQQVSCGLRAAMMELEERNDGAGAAVRVARRLYASNNRAFVTHSPDNRHEYKPLRNAPLAVIERWLAQEAQQRIAWSKGKSVAFGAVPTQAEWDAYGIKPQARTVVAQMAADIEGLVHEAINLDNTGRFVEADTIYETMQEMCKHLDYFDLWENSAV